MTVKVRKVKAYYLTAKWAPIGDPKGVWSWFNVDWLPF